MSDLPPEDAKLVVLARSTRARTSAAEGAALRDLDGRTYVGASVSLASLELSAIAVCIATAVASGSKGAEAVVVLGPDAVADDDVNVLREFAGGGVPVLLADSAGRVTTSRTT